MNEAIEAFNCGMCSRIRELGEKFAELRKSKEGNAIVVTMYKKKGAKRMLGEEEMVSEYA